MTGNELELARRVVACKAWRWIPGMLAVRPGVISMRVDFGPFEPPPEYDWIPGLTDTATYSCLLTLVRDAYNAPEACTGKVGPFWYVYPRTDNGIDQETEPIGMTWNDRYTTELAALVEALEAACSQ